MTHDKRVFSIAKAATAEELAEKLKTASWCCCAGFELDGVLFLNDSFTEDSVQEYGVVIPTDGDKGIQVESITFGWVERQEKAVRYIRECVAYKADILRAPIRMDVTIRRDHGRTCHLCE